MRNAKQRRRPGSRQLSGRVDLNPKRATPDGYVGAIDVCDRSLNGCINLGLTKEQLAIDARKHVRSMRLRRHFRVSEKLDERAHGNVALGVSCMTILWTSHRPFRYPACVATSRRRARAAPPELKALSRMSPVPPCNRPWKSSQSVGR